MNNENVELDVDLVDEGLWEDDVVDDPEDDLDDLTDPPYDGPRCVGCGCSEDNPCEGGCIWATPALCSRCAR